MSTPANLSIGQSLVAALQTGAEIEAILEMFAEDMAFNLPGDRAAFPWIGSSTGKASLRELLDGLKHMLVLERFDVQDIVAGEDRVVVLGALASRVITTQRLIESPFAIVLSITAEKISGFLMLEDSFAVSNAAHP